MAYRCLALREILFSVVGVGLLSGLILPVFVTFCRVDTRRTGCASNLRQLYQLGTVYASTNKGQWPDAKGDDLWLSFTRTTPPLIDPDQIELLACPVRCEDIEPGQTDYFGPRQSASTLKPTDILGGDKRGNHGEEFGGSLLYKDGSVLEIKRSDSRWKECPESSSPLRSRGLLK
jgi:hypothetical protein